jgi:ribosomal protein S18 acetylase RimI-like enzyme
LRKRKTLCARHNPAIIGVASFISRARKFARQIIWYETLAADAIHREAWRMEDVALRVRKARRDDAREIARIYIESWHDTYAAILPSALLCAMTARGQTARWRSAIIAKGREAVIVADCPARGIVGMASFGPSRDRDLAFDGEIYTLYVDPMFFGCGTGRALFAGCFETMRAWDYASCVVWAHAKNPARFFYEKMGGRLIAERTVRMMGDAVPESGFGWKKIESAVQSPAR